MTILTKILHKFTGKNRRRQAELEFLPAALEIVETPPNPAGRAILWSIMVFFVIAVSWAMVGQVDIVAVAYGKIIPTGKIKIIQPLQTGIVAAIHIEEGQQVKKGEVLIDLDTTETKADTQRLKVEQQTAKEEKKRLTALLSATDNLNPESQHPNPDPQILNPNPSLLTQRIQTELADYQSRINALNQEIAEKQSERNATQSRINQLKQTVPLITERAMSYKKLLQQNTVARNQWLELEQLRIEQSKELEVQRHRLQQTEAAIATLQEHLKSHQQQTRVGYLKELAETESRIGVIEQELVKASQRNTLQQLKAPVDGVVQQLAVHTIGGVVTPAQELLRIVPREQHLEVEASFLNKDIGFVKAGQIAEIKIDAFPFTRYGTIDAEITHISEDAVQDEQQGLIYTARVAMHKDNIKVEDRLVKLSPGMAVSVEAKTGKRRLIEYLMSPLLRYRDESVRER